MSKFAPIFLCAAAAGLLALGLIMMASTSVWVNGVEEPYLFLRKQTVFAVLGVVVACGCAWLPVAWLRRYGPWLLPFVCVLLGLCFVPSIGIEHFGAKRWIGVPLIGQVQPSELARLAVILALACWFQHYQSKTKSFVWGFFLPGLIAVVPVALIALETDIGTALSISVMVGTVMFCVGTRIVYLAPTALVAIVGAVYFIMTDDNRMLRIDAWRNLEDPVHQLGVGMQQWRALLALGNGGPWGAGLGEGVEKFGTLTFAHIDFVFPVVGEELGLLATLGTVGAFVMIAICGLVIAMQAETLFDRCLALGLTCMIVVPAMVNIGVTTALLPNDGLPLPFVSYGGTSLLFSMAAVGLLVGVHRRTPPPAEQDFVLGREAKRQWVRM